MIKRIGFDGLFWAVVLTFSSGVLPAYGLDFPHSDANAISCISCHVAHGGSLWEIHVPVTADDTPTNKLCWSCHNDIVAPYEKTHSSLSIDSDYGEWTVECRACHKPHFQAQTKTYETESYLFTGPSTLVTNNTIFKEAAGWSENQWAGMLVIANANASARVYHKIVSNTADTLAVDGTIDTSTAGSGDTFAIVLGKMIKETVNDRAVKFFNRSGANSFADADPAVLDGICEVCHTMTLYHRNDGTGAPHNAGSRCTECHSHQEGFKVLCDSCHGNPPVDESSLVFNPPQGTGSQTAGAHDSHTRMQIECANCHLDSAGSGESHKNQSITLGFSVFNGAYLGGSYAGQSGVSYSSSEPNTSVSDSGSKECSSIYCHGSTMAPNGGTDTTPVWDDPSTAACGACHGSAADNPPIRGSHYKHTAQYLDQLNWGYNYACDLCHKDPVVDSSMHVNNKSEVVFSIDPKTAGGTYSGTETMLDAYGTCNVYCHSTVQTSPPGGAPTDRGTPAWGDPNYSPGHGLGCDACHYYYDSTPRLTTGSHEKHLQYLYWGLGSGAECVICHNYKQADESYSCGCCHEIPGVPFVWSPASAWHADHTIDVRFGPLYGGPALTGSYSGTPEPNDPYGQCSNIYCHGNGTGGTSYATETRGIPDNVTPYWGSGAIACSACHGNPPDYANGSPKANSHAKHRDASITCDKCHYNTTRDNVTIYSRSYHVNRRYDVTRNTTVTGLTFTYTYYSTGGSCTNVSCHAGTAVPTTVNWGTTF